MTATPIVIMATDRCGGTAAQPFVASQATLRNAGFTVDIAADDWETLVTAPASQNAPADRWLDMFFTNWLVPGNLQPAGPSPMFEPVRGDSAGSAWPEDGRPLKICRPSSLHVQRPQTSLTVAKDFRPQHGGRCLIPVA